MILLARLAGVALGFPLLAFFFGWALLARWPGLRRAERFAASWGVSFAFLALCEFLAFLTGADQAKFNRVALVLMLLAATAGARGSIGGKSFGRVAGLCALGYLHLVCIQALLQNYVGSHWYFDWWMHYDEVLVFRKIRPLETNWAGYTLDSRTPLFNLAAAFVQSLAGDDFWVYQLASTLMNSCFLAPLYLLLRDLFGPRIGRLGLILAGLNLWLLHNAWFTWPKMLTAYYLLLSLHFYLRSIRLRDTNAEAGRRFALFAWTSGLLGFMTHQSAAIYLAALLVHGAVLARRGRSFRPRVGEVFAAIILAVGIIGPWYGWLIRTFGIDHVRKSSPATVEAENIGTSYTPLRIVTFVTANAATSVVPVYVFVAPFHGDRPLANLYDAVTAIYFSQLPGLVTLSLSAYLLTMAYRRLRRSGLAGLHVPSLGPDWGAIWCFLLLGALGTALLHPNIIGHGIAHAACFPSSIVAACLAWGVLGRAPKRTAALVCAGMVAEFVLMFWSHCWMADNRPEVLDPNLSNPWYKDNARIDFLFDQLEAGRYVFLAAAVMVEAILVVWLFHWWRAKDPTCKRGARIFPGADGRRDELDTRPLAP